MSKKLKKWVLLGEKLLALGGSRVCHQDEPHLDSLVERGQVFTAKGRQYLRGELHRYHAIACLHYAETYALGSGPSCELVTGYALHQDGLWRQHSWLWDGKRVIEPNLKPILYFGVMLTPAEAAQFVFCQVVAALPGFREVVGRATGYLHDRDRSTFLPCSGFAFACPVVSSGG